MKSDKFRLLFYSMLFLLAPTVRAYCQSPINADSLLLHFKSIVNEYRIANGITPLQVDAKMKSHTAEWAKRMGEKGLVGHGAGLEAFSNRINRNEYLNSFEVVLENCTELITPIKPLITDVLAPPNVKPYIVKSCAQKLKQREYAMYCFLMWKNSPAHNKALLNSQTTHFYLSSSTKNGRSYLCYVGRSS